MSVLLDLVKAVSKVEERLDSIEDGESHRRELLRLVVKEAVQEAITPLEKRVGEMETKVKLVQYGAGVAAPILSWLLPKLIALVPVLLLLGCGHLPDPKAALRDRAEELCFDSPTSNRRILSEAEAEACERLLNSR